MTSSFHINNYTLTFREHRKLPKSRFQKIARTLSLNNIHLYGEDGAIKRYKDTTEVLKEWAYTRLEKYKLRKEHQLDVMQKELVVVSAKVRFIQDVIDEKIKIMNRKMKEVEAQLSAAKYPVHSDAPFPMSPCLDADAPQLHGVGARSSARRPVRRRGRRGAG